MSTVCRYTPSAVLIPSGVCAVYILLLFDERSNFNLHYIHIYTRTTVEAVIHQLMGDLWLWRSRSHGFQNRVYFQTVSIIRR